MKQQPIKFNEDSNTKLEDLKDSKVYKLYQKDLQDFTKDEKVWLTEQVNTNMFFDDSIPLKGWKFDFSDKLQKYVMKTDFSLREYYAVDGVSLRDWILSYNDCYIFYILKIPKEFYSYEI